MLVLTFLNEWISSLLTMIVTIYSFSNNNIKFIFIRERKNWCLRTKEMKHKYRDLDIWINMFHTWFTLKHIMLGDFHSQQQKIFLILILMLSSIFFIINFIILFVHLFCEMYNIWFIGFIVFWDELSIYIYKNEIDCKCFCCLMILNINIYTRKQDNSAEFYVLSNGQQK